MNALGQFEYAALSDFIGDNWGNFVQFMEERDTDEAQCDDIASALDKLAGRS